MQFPFTGPLTGAALVAALAVVAGGFPIRGRPKIFAVAMLAGVVIGALGGALVYAPVRAARDPEGKGPFRDKVEAHYQRQGVASGVVGGAIAGIIFGVAVGLARRGSGQRNLGGFLANN